MHALPTQFNLSAAKPQNYQPRIHTDEHGFVCWMRHLQLLLMKTFNKLPQSNNFLFILLQACNIVFFWQSFDRSSYAKDQPRIHTDETRIFKGYSFTGTHFFKNSVAKNFELNLLKTKCSHKRFQCLALIVNAFIRVESVFIRGFYYLRPNPGKVCTFMQEFTCNVIL